MKVGFIGCVESSRASLKTLLSISEISVKAVVTREKSAVNSDFCDLTDLCIGKSIPFYLENPSDREKSVDFLAQYDLDLIFCIGWSYLLPNKVLTLPKKGVVGFHPAKLPSNRGRHPIIWALALGLNETASTFFLMDEGADSGPILSQELIDINCEDNASSLYNKILLESQKQLLKLASDLANGKEKVVKQDEKEASYWRKRSRKDGLIDFRMSAESIYNLIRALSSPYPGAELMYNNEYYVVNRAKISDKKYATNIEPGKVIIKNDEGMLIKAAGDSAIWLLGVAIDNIEVGSYL